VFLRKVQPGSATAATALRSRAWRACRGSDREGARNPCLPRENEHEATEELTPRRAGPVQIQLFEPVNYEIAGRIRNLKIDELRPIEALKLLSELQEELKRQ